MEITEVRVKLMEDTSDRLRAFCSITFDDAFVVRDLKIIEGTNGAFVAMPSRKLTAHCPQCGCKNHLRSLHCNQCGARLKNDLAVRDQEGRAKLYADIAHPINSACREMIQQRVIVEYRSELQRAESPDYISRYEEYFHDAGEEGGSFDAIEEKPAAAQKPLDQPKIEPPEPGPRPPHRAPSTESTEPAKQKSADEFGSGIF